MFNLDEVLLKLHNKCKFSLPVFSDYYKENINRFIIHPKIGRGGNCSVYSFKWKNNIYAVKIINSIDYRTLYEEDSVTLDANIKEILIGYIIGLFYQEEQCFNCLNNLGSFVESYKGNKFIFNVMEKMDTSLRDLNFHMIPRKLGTPNKIPLGLSKSYVDFIDNVIIQFSGLLYTLQENFRFVHYDMHDSNVFIRFLNEDEMYKTKKLKDVNKFHYKIGKYDYLIDNMGFVVKFADFGLSRIVSNIQGLKNLIMIDDEDFTGYYNSRYDIAVNNFNDFHWRIRIYDFGPHISSIERSKFHYWYDLNHFLLSWYNSLKNKEIYINAIRYLKNTYIDKICLNFADYNEDTNEIITILNSIKEPFISNIHYENNLYKYNIKDMTYIIDVKVICAHRPMNPELNKYAKNHKSISYIENVIFDNFKKYHINNFKENKNILSCN